MSSEKKEKNNKRNFVLFIFVTVTAIFLSCVCLELLLRKGIIENNIWVVARSRTEINNILNESNNKKKLLVLGDSFIRNNHNVDWFLENKLKKSPVSVLNVAFSGYSPVDYFLNLKKFGILFKPDVVLLGYYAGNDLSDVESRFKNNKPIVNANILQPFHLSLKYEKYYFGYYLSQWIQTKIKSSVLKKQWIEKWQINNVDTNVINLYKKGLINPYLVDVGLNDPDHILNNLLIKKLEYRLTWDKISNLLKDINNICMSINAELVIAVFPNTAQINRDFFKLYESMHLKMNPSTLNNDKPQQLIKKLCNELKIDCLDMLPTFRSQKEKRFFWETDDHMNNEGAELAASLIYDFLENKTKLFENEH